MLCLLEATSLTKAHPKKPLNSASSYAPAGSLSGAFHGHAACGRPLLRLPPPLGRRRRRRSRAGPRVGREAEVAAQGDVHEGLRAARRLEGRRAFHRRAGPTRLLAGSAAVSSPHLVRGALCKSESVAGLSLALGTA